MTVEGFGPNLKHVLREVGNAFLTQTTSHRVPGDSTLEK